MAVSRAWVLGLLCAWGSAALALGCSSDNSGSNGASGSSSMAGSSSGGSSNGGGAGAANGGSTHDGAANGGSANGGAAQGGTGACVPDYACKPVAPNTGDDEADCVARVNQFRACACLAPLAADPAGKDCADQQAKYDADKNQAHAGFGANICTPQFFAQNECPGYSSIRQTIDTCAQQMFGEGPPPMQPCNGTCYSKYGHFINMTGKYKSVTCGFYTTADGKVWTVQNYR